jgi:hypothetical protein
MRAMETKLYILSKGKKRQPSPYKKDRVAQIYFK